VVTHLVAVKDTIVSSVYPYLGFHVHMLAESCLDYRRNQCVGEVAYALRRSTCSSGRETWKQLHNSLVFLASFVQFGNKAFFS